MADETENPVTPEEPRDDASAADVAPAEEPVAVAPDAATDEAEEAPGDPLAGLSSKERRRTVRARHDGEARPQRSAEERQEERRAVRAGKAAARSRRRGQEREKARAAGPGEGTPPAEREASAPQTRLGTVVSSKADKTITVRIDIARRHRRYQKIMRTSTTLHAHDERNDAGEGDVVRVVECRPMSRMKRWRLVEILERAK